MHPLAKSQKYLQSWLYYKYLFPVGFYIKKSLSLLFKEARDGILSY